MNFRSDNASGIAPEIMAALAEANAGTAPAYGDDAWTRRLEAAFNDLFEREVAVFPVATGTAANALALSALTPPWGQVFCHRGAHIEVDEAGAPEFFSGGAKLALLDGPGGKVPLPAFEAALAAAGWGVQHHPQPHALSIAQASECGTVYTPAEVAALAAAAHARGLTVHMDGARLANALARLGVSPADATWRNGVDVLSFGATKNGALAAEAVVFFDPALARDFLFRRKRAGHLFSKMRFLSAQLLAYVTDGLWLRMAGHANAMAGRLADGLAAVPGIALAHPVEANEVFVRTTPAMERKLLDAGIGLHRWETAGADVVLRLVCAFDTDPADIDRAVATARTLAGETT